MSQVGGHPTIHFSPDNSLLFKPTNAQEIEFYQALTTRPELTRLRWFTPEFLGTLRLEGGIPQDKEKKEVPADEPVVSDKADDSAEIGQHDVKSLALGEETSETRAQAVRSTESVVLTNLTQAFTHPSVLDVKLGTVLYDEHASPEKKARMEKAAQDTTSGSCGIRLVGFSNWDPSNQTSIMTDKAFGKALTPETLPSGIARFFPLKTSSSTSGLSSSLLLEVLQNIHLDLTTIHSILLETEARFVGSSVLIVYESDPTVLQEALDIEGGEGDSDGGWFEDDSVSSSSSSSSSSIPPPSASTLPSLSTSSTIEQGAGSSQVSNVLEEKEERMGPPPSVRVKMIDFAHSKLTLGEGPDLGVLKGLKTLIRLIEDRIEEIKV